MIILTGAPVNRTRIRRAAHCAWPPVRSPQARVTRKRWAHSRTAAFALVGDSPRLIFGRGCSDARLITRADRIV